MIENADPKPGQKICDLCAGIGNFTAYLTEWMFGMYGIPYEETLKNIWLVEIDDENCAKIREIFGEDIKLIQCDARELERIMKNKALF